MSNVLFTPPPFLAWSVFKIPQLNTIVQTATSGKTTRAQLWSNPVWTFKLTWDAIKDLNATPADIDLLMDFFLSRAGSFDTFLFTDPSDFTVTTQNFGTGDGSTTSFQLTRNLATGFAESIQNVNGSPSIFISGALQTGPSSHPFDSSPFDPNVFDTGAALAPAYTIGPTGIITFTVAPIPNAALTWTGSFYYRVRFKNDLQEFEQFVSNFWSAKSVELISERV